MLINIIGLAATKGTGTFIFLYKGYFAATPAKGSGRNG